MIGLKEDTEAKIKERLRVADEIDSDIFALDYLTPVPNSPDWRYGIKKGWFDPDKIDLRDWDFQHPVIPTDHLTIEEVGRLGAWCMREYYSKPERIHRIMESNYHMKVKLCVKDFMNNISKWEANSRVTGRGIIMVSIQTNMNWDAVALSKYNKMLNLIPIFHRRLAQEVVNKKAEQGAVARGSSTVEEADIVQAFLTEVPKAFYSLMIRIMDEVGF